MVTMTSQDTTNSFPQCVPVGAVKPWTIAFVSLLAIVVCVTLYTELPHYRSYLPSTVVEYLHDDPYTDCFDSPYVVCQPYSRLTQWKPQKTDSRNHDVSKSGTSLPVFMTSLVEHRYIHQSFKDFDFSVCPLPCLLIPRNRVQEARGVIVDGVWAQEGDFPKTRPEGQVYVVSGLESPKHYKGSLLKSNSVYKDQINLTLTYRVDSNIQFFYNGLCLNDQPRKTKAQLKKIFESKTRTAAWFVSNCKTHSKRMAYVKELQKHIDVDIYGKCGNKSYQKLGSEKQILNSTYKFYLSFENSFCKDYVTEKFFKLFRSDQYIVPVVRGGMDYEKYFPPFTFINAGGFQTPADLGRYLKDVGGDFEKYMNFLETKDKYVTQPGQYFHVKRMCDVCRLFHRIGPEVTSRYSDIGRWLSKDMCYKPEENYLVYNIRKQSHYSK